VTSLNVVDQIGLSGYHENPAEMELSNSELGFNRSAISHQI